MTSAPRLDALDLERVPPAPDLQAWNAADELLLERLPPTCRQPGSLLVVNDAFGALSIALGSAVRDWWSDSAMAIQALAENSHRNHRPPPQCVVDPDDLQGPYPAAIIQVPKSLKLFEWQLSHIASRLSAADGVVYVLGMVKHLSRGHQTVMNRWFGSANPGRAVKKARCVELRHPLAAPAPQPQRHTAPGGLQLVNYPGSFGENTPDPGALAFLPHFGDLPDTGCVLDLGCGNGILALHYLRDHPGARAILVDESAQALASARASTAANDLAERVQYHHNNGLTGLGLTQLPLILCNPPFHQQTTLTSDIAHQLFEQAAGALARDGELWVVGNRHLGYHRTLKRWFTSVTVQSRHPKFVVLRCFGIR